MVAGGVQILVVIGEQVKTHRALSEILTGLFCIRIMGHESPPLFNPIEPNISKS